jgi:hypothetical protein
MESAFPMSFEEVVDTVCENNQQISKYLGPKNKLRNNMKLRSILEMLQQHSRVKIVQMKPVVLQYMRSDKEKSAALHNASTNMGINEGIACDPCDTCDSQTYTLAQNSDPDKYQENFTQGSPGGSHTSHTSHSYIPKNGDGGNGNGDSLLEQPYEHLIQGQTLPTIGQYYNCKEHPEVWDISLRGLQESHFKPVHGRGTEI